MKKIIAVFIALSNGAGAVGCGNGDKEKELVCCESYGYGAEMKKTPSSFKKIPRDQCTFPKGATGGGRDIVDMSKCSEEKELVCCESYRLVSHGEIIPYSFQIVPRDQCTFPKGATGGGREIVNMSKCSQGSEVMKKPPAPVNDLEG